MEVLAIQPAQHLGKILGRMGKEGVRMITHFSVDGRELLLVVSAEGRREREAKNGCATINGHTYFEIGLVRARLNSISHCMDAAHGRHRPSW